MDERERAGDTGTGHPFRGTDDRGGGLRGLADVAMVQAADFGKLHDSARVGERDWPDIRRIRVERDMRARPVIVGEVTD